MAVFLAVCVLFLALVIIYLAVRLQSMIIAKDRYRHETGSLTRTVGELRYQLDKKTDELIQLESTINSVSPPSHDVPPLDVEELMTASDDPVWELVVDCRSVGLMNDWINKNPQFRGSQAHRKYSEFATWILNLPESRRSVEGVRAVLQHG